MTEEMTMEQIREMKAAYAREWRRTHPEQSKAINDAYWQRKAKETARLQALVQTIPLCPCGHRPYIRQNRKKYVISCIDCHRSLPPCDTAEEALEAWKKLPDCSRKRTTEAAAFRTPEQN
jgi:hypothetical protein